MKNDTKNKPFFIAKEEASYPAGKGVTRQFVGYDKNIMMLKVSFEQGARGDVHSHPHAQTTYVVSGVFEFTVGDEKKIIEAGDGLYAEPNIPHGCVCLQKGALIDVFTPAREDFLESV